MTRLKTIPLAITAVLLTAGAALGFATMPDAATKGIDKATSASGHAVPVRDVTPPATVPDGDANAATDENTTEDTTADAPKTGTHGADVSAVAKAPDTTPDTNHGADVSAVAKANHGQTVAADHRPTDAGKPADPGNSHSHP